MKKNILLLGGFGFIGTNILKFIDTYYLHLYDVIVFDKFENHPHDIQFDCVKNRYAGDFSDSALIKSIFENNQIDLIIHSLSSTVPSTSNNAKYDIESNLIPTIDILNLMVAFDVYDIVFISSGGAIYGESISDIKFKEVDNLCPLSSYGVVKLAIEKYLLQYASLYKLRPLILRLSNPYGKYHYSYKQGVCNVAIRSAIENKVFKVWGNGQACKDYIYIDDFCTILFQLLSQSVHNKVLNIASGCVLTLNQILEEIKLLRPEFTWVHADSSIFDVSHFELDTQALFDIIGEFKFSDFKSNFKIINNWIS